MLRAFIAIQIPAEIKKAIAAQTASLQSETRQSVRWVENENIHLTLKFLGEISSSSLDLLTQSLHTECQLHSPFELSVHGLGCFPNPHRPRVIWVGLGAPPELGRLQHKIEASLARLGYEMEEKPFSPHLTIGRMREQVKVDDSRKILSAVETNHGCSLGSFTARTVHLIKSDLQPSGPVYTPIFSAALGMAAE